MKDFSASTIAWMNVIVEGKTLKCKQQQLLWSYGLSFRCFWALLEAGRWKLGFSLLFFNNLGSKWLLECVLRLFLRIVFLKVVLKGPQWVGPTFCRVFQPHGLIRSWNIYMKWRWCNRYMRILYSFACAVATLSDRVLLSLLWESKKPDVQSPREEKGTYKIVLSWWVWPHGEMVFWNEKCRSGLIKWTSC